MPQKNSLIYRILLFVSIQSSVLSNLCPDSASCDCTLIGQTNLEILCNAILSPSELPTLNNATLQAGVTSLRVGSTSVGTSGPLTSLPTNICSAYPNIAVLDLSSNMITGLLNTSELACLGSNLLSVDLSKNLINQTDKNFFSANRQLQTIDLSSNNLQTMPIIDGAYFLNFPSTITSMNFSLNKITNADLWPLFVKTGNFMTIDMSSNSITSFTNTVPIYVQQFTATPDPRAFYLNNNQIQSLSDLLVERYGACSTTSSVATSYFVVGISNLLLTSNPLICDCESYNLRKFINDRRNDFPLINNGSALLNQATCASPSEVNGQSYIFSNSTQLSSCENYTLPSTSDAFCSVYTNSSSSTIAPPTYWLTTTTQLTTIIYGNETTIDSGGGSAGSNNNGNDKNSANNSASPAWYIIVGIVLGLVLLLFLICLGCFLCRDRLLPEKYRSKFRNNIHNLNNSYEPIIRHSEASSQAGFPSNGVRPRRASISTSTGRSDDRDNGMFPFDNDGTSPNGHHDWNDQNHPEQETQTCFQIVRSKPSAPAQPQLSRNPQRLPNNNNNNNNTNNNLVNPHREPKIPSSVAMNTNTVVKGIPISSVHNKNASILSNGNDTQTDTSTSELSVTSIPLTPSKRAKVLPPLKSGVYMDLNNHNLLNTSAGAIPTNQRQRRLSSSWTQRAHQHFLTPQPLRPQSMSTLKSVFTQEDSSDEEILSIPTVESSTIKSSKALRTLPLLNITVVPAWIDHPQNSV